jgi:hypothetical protein
MHRGCVPFISPEHFETIYWPTLRPIIENLWAAGHQTLFYAEGNWNAHLDAFAELPPASIVYHVDMADIVQVHRKLGGRFCISGGMSNFLLAFGTEQQVRDRVRELIDSVGADGGYIMDSSAIVQNDGRSGNIRAMTEETRKYGAYPGGHSSGAKPAPAAEFRPTPIPAEWSTRTPPGVCVSWERKRKELPPIQGDEAMFERIWNNVEALGYMFIYQVLESF